MAVAEVSSRTFQSFNELPLVPASVHPAAIKNATTIGAMPCLKARIARNTRLRWPYWAAA